MTARALLLTDLVDSTLLGERLGDARAAEVWAEHDRRARELLLLAGAGVCSVVLCHFFDAEGRIVDHPACQE